MDRGADTGVADRLPLEDLQEVFEREPVRLVLCFGSQASGRVHDHSDVDLAIELDGLQPGDEGYNDVFFRVYREVTDVLDRDDVDIVDVHSLSGSLARTVLADGVRIYGMSARVESLREQLDTELDDRSPRERLDEAIERMDEHLA